MNKINLLEIFSFLIVFCSFPAYAQHNSSVAHWSYGGSTGPAYWGELDKEFKTCSTGMEQSPVNINTHEIIKSSLKPITIKYENSNGEINNDGHSISISLSGNNSAILNDVEYKLIKFHFHSPSEELIDNNSHHLVAHLVHKSADNRLAVIAVLFTLGNENSLLKQIFSAIPKTGLSNKLSSISITSILPQELSYYYFMGSLTTPPCSEGVSWYVLKREQSISKQELDIFQSYYKNNARPVQPLNHRIIYEGP